MTTFHQLESAVRQWEGSKDIAMVYRDAIPEFGNSLMETCCTYSGKLQEFLEELGIKTDIKRSGKFHTFLECQTEDRGIVWADPTLGQFIHYPFVFVGDKERLSVVFYDQTRKFLFQGVELSWMGLGSIQDRETLFDICYSL